MKSNDHIAIHLLEWIKQQSSQKYNNILQSQFLINTLGKISPLFNKIIFQFNYNQSINIIEYYLEKNQGKRFKKQYKDQLNKLQSMQQFIKIVLFLCIKSNIKNIYVKNIFELQPYIQDKLMRNLKEIQQQLQNVIEIKQIIDKLIELQQENDLLHQQLYNKQKINLQLKQGIYELQNQINKKNIELNQLKQQKKDILDLLSINDLKPYVFLLKSLQQESKQFQKLITKFETQNQNLFNEQNNLKMRIFQNNDVIAALNEELQKYKEVCRNLKDQLETQSQKDFLLLDNKSQTLSTTMKISHKVKNSIITNNSMDELTDSFNDEESELEKVMRMNQDYKERIEGYGRMNYQLSNQIAKLKDKIEILSRNNAYYFTNWQEMKKQYNIFINEYEQTL